MKNDNLLNMIKQVYRDQRLKIILFSTVIWGICAHGLAMFNKISIHDDIDNILTSAGIRSARWGGEALDYFMTYTIVNFPSTPLFNGILALLCLALSVYVVTCHFEYESKLGLFVLTGIAITFPAITSFFGYVFTIHPYCFAILLSIYGSHLPESVNLITNCFPNIA